MGDITPKPNITHLTKYKRVFGEGEQKGRWATLSGLPNGLNSETPHNAAYLFKNGRMWGV